MIKKLTKHGNSFALVIDRGVLDLLKVDVDTPLDISTDGKSLIVSPVIDPVRQRELARAIEKSNRKFGRLYKRLAAPRDEKASASNG